MILLPLHLPPRMELKAMRSLEVSLKNKTKQNQPHNTKHGERHQTNSLCDAGFASARQELLPARTGIGAAPASLFFLLRNSSRFLCGACTDQMVQRRCLETTASPPGCLGGWAGLPVVTGAGGRLGLNKWLLLKE